MIEKILPKKIKEKIEGLTYTVDKIGLSDSIVYIFDDYILKVMTNTIENRNQIAVQNLLSKKMPIPSVIECELVGDEIFVLQTKIKGDLLCDTIYLNNKEMLLLVIKKALDNLYSYKTESKKLLKMLDLKLSIVESNIQNNKLVYNDIDIEFRNKFKTLNEMLEYLKNNKPKEKLVLSHGDLCLPNIIAKNDDFIGLIDVGYMGLSDKYQDIATIYKSLKRNFDGYYNGIKYPGYEDKMLFDYLGIERDDNKLFYYLLLDELIL